MARIQNGVRSSGPEGSIVRYGTARRAKRVRTNGWQWSEEAEQIFFDVLASSANVLMAAEEAGFSTPTVYRQRQMRPSIHPKGQTIRLSSIVTN